jgi:murein endopeptidase/LysM repeat protein
VIGGERLDDIADRYGVRKSSLVQWNKLDPSKPFLRAGQTLRVYAARTPPPREEFLYTVKRGDTWDKIARAHGVDADVLRKRWNPRVPQRFKAGQEIVIWVEGTPEPQEGELPPEEIEELEGVAATPSTARRSPIGSGRPLPLKPIRSGSFAVGAPNKGRLSGSAILPPNDQLYSLMRPENAYGTTHALNHLQLAIARWRRDFGFVGKLVIGDISKRGGGRLSPHSSHRTGRDVDIRLPLSGDTIDWEASWALVHELVKTGQVEYIFLGTAQQKVLHRVARRAGVKNAELEKILQYPHAAKTNHGLVRHAAGHSTHIHVRFTCGPGSPACKSY